MIDAPVLLKALQGLEKELEDDLRTRVTPDAATSPQEQEVATELDAMLRAQHREARDSGRTAHAFEVWRDEFLTQVAVAWILGCVFVRFMEDNGLVEPPRLSGPGGRRQDALDQHELYFQDPERRTHSDREYLLDVFEQTQKLSAAREIFDAQHNPLWAVGLSGDFATKLLQFWQRIVPETGVLDHDFTDPSWSTRFLGDLYQDLSEDAQKKYALLQTPNFVEEFILERTLTPALEEFGFQEVRLIDPTCGSGHFLLGAFHRLLDLWVKHEPGTNPRELVRRAADQVYGVDLNPFAVAIAKFRLLVEALKACGVKRLEDAPAFDWNLAVGDSLLHGKRLPTLLEYVLFSQQSLAPEDDPLRHVYETEDAEALKKILGQPYHAVVGNPPYITVKDKALNQAYRDAYSSCSGKYSLGVPFTERFFDLCVAGDASHSAGFVGMITTNAFMKREFGKKLIEQTLPRLDLTHVIDTSGAYIPGHGTPTVILFGRNRPPVADEVRTVMGIRGEPSTPEDPSQGQVWQAIMSQLDTPGSESDFVSVADYGRERFKEHPWSLGGGGAAELKELIEAAAEKRLGDISESIGFASFTGLDDAFVFSARDLARKGVPDELVKSFVYGEAIRDWAVASPLSALTPYDDARETVPLVPEAKWARVLWPLRTNLGGVLSFGGKTRSEIGDDWWTWYRWVPEKYRTPLSIAFAEVSTHNHFVLDRGGKVFKQTAPVIKLPPDATEDDHLALLALLNSSTACFWLKQVCHCKGSTVDTKGARQTTIEFENFYQLAGSRVEHFPVNTSTPLGTARRLTQAAEALSQVLHHPSSEILEESALLRIADQVRSQLGELIALQEEIDWSCYSAYGLTEDDLTYPSDEPPPIELGQRAFEILMARKMARGELETTWFERHSSTPITELPPYWPDEYRQLVERRIALIESDRNIGLIEQPEYKRRWNTEPFEETKQRALKFWLLGRLETPAYWPAPELQTTARLADRAGQDADFMQVAELYAGHPDFEVATLVRDLVEGEAVPSLPACRYKPSGLRNREQWERTWGLQRQEDAIDARTELDASDPNHLSESEAKALKQKEVGDIPVPPKYKSSDFLKTTFWSHRGKLDVPKERFVSFPHCEREADPSPVVGWAGWDHLQLAQATAAYYLKMKEEEGWPAERLTPLLASLREALPWIHQWHNDLDPAYGARMGDYFEDFTSEESRSLGLTPDQIDAWTPPARTRTRRKKAGTKKTSRKKKTKTEAKSE